MSDRNGGLPWGIQLTAFRYRLASAKAPQWFPLWMLVPQDPAS